jgi:hypothetical protein
MLTTQAEYVHEHAAMVERQLAEVLANPLSPWRPSRTPYTAVTIVAS